MPLWDTFTGLSHQWHLCSTVTFDQPHWYYHIYIYIYLVTESLRHYWGPVALLNCLNRLSWSDWQPASSRSQIGLFQRGVAYLSANCFSLVPDEGLQDLNAGVPKKVFWEYWTMCENFSFICLPKRKTRLWCIWCFLARIVKKWIINTHLYFRSTRNKVFSCFYHKPPLKNCYKKANSLKISLSSSRSEIKEVGRCW